MNMIIKIIIWSAFSLKVRCFSENKKSAIGLALLRMNIGK